MIYLFHGDDHSRSRMALSDAKKNAADPTVIDGEKVLVKDLRSILGTSSLYGQDSLIIENIFSRLRSKEKDTCLDQLINYNSTKDIFIWEKKELTPAWLKKIPKTWKVKKFKLPALIFDFLDTLVPGNNKNAHSLFNELIENKNEPIVILTMITRHIITLIQLKSSHPPRLAPWQIGKLKGQASKWELDVLINLIDQLYDLDYKVKTGQTKLDYATLLDILLLQVLG